MLSFLNVSKEYLLDKEHSITPVRNLNLEIKEGEFIVITGRSGTGKTTLLNLAAGMVKPTTGSVKIDDVNLANMTDKQISALRSKKIGFIFQFPSLLPSLSIRDNVSLPGLFRIRNGNGSKNNFERAAMLIDKFGLKDKLDVYPKQLSAGEQKRIVIARSLINEPQLILADEPTSDLDNRTEKEIMNILLEINARGVTFLIVTHSLDLITFATRAFEMENGYLKEIKTR